MKSRNKNLEIVVSALFYKNKGRILSLETIRKFLKNQNFLDSLSLTDYYAWGYGVSGTTINIIHKLKKQGRFIFSPIDEDGYVELDLNDSRSIEYWDKILTRSEQITEQIPISEQKLLKRMLREFVQNCEKKEIKNELIKVAIRHGVEI